MTRRLLLKRAGQTLGVIAFLPTARAIGKIAHGSQRGTYYYEHTIIAMGTTARVGVYATSEAEANHVITSAFTELKRLESLMTLFDPSSEISQINARAGEAVPVSNDVFSIIESAIAYSKETGGAFDITIEPLMRLWGFRNESNALSRLPSRQEIDTALRVVGYRQIETGRAQHVPTVRLRSKNAKLDLGGIAVGNALDKMTAIIRAAKIEHAFIDISGDMFALGAPHKKMGWPVAIPDPQNTSRLIYSATITNEALATSGNYESFVVYQAQKFGHIMDPHDGRSAHRVLSSTVIAKSGLGADALSTASFVTAERYRETQLVLVDPAGNVRVI